MLRNIRIYPWYQAAFYIDFAGPVYFLYFLQHLSLSEVLALEGLFQLSAVIFEVPSGYFSDRFGRRRTLQCSALAMCITYSLFLNGTTFFVFAIGQIFRAVGWSFKSGSDVSLFYDSLDSVGRGAEYENLEGRAVQFRLVGVATAALIGGWIAMNGLWWAVFATAVVNFGLLVLTNLFTEPNPENREKSVEVEMWSQLRACIDYLKSMPLAWLFGYGILSVVLDHIPYQFYQQYIQLLGIRLGEYKNATPLVTGAHMAAAMAIGAVAAGVGRRFVGRASTGVLLLSASFVHVVMIFCMAAVLHPIVAALVVFREIPNALKAAPMNARILPHIAVGHRATYLSLQGLSSRLVLGLFVTLIALVGADSPSVTFPELRSFLWICFGLCGAGFLGLAWCVRIVKNI
jgi:hypothetical protein